MALPLAEILALATQCAPAIAPATLLSIAKVESGFEPLAIGVNGKPRAAFRPSTAQEAVTKARALIAAGRSVDLGIAQINSKNLRWLGLSVEAAFDPCRNLAAAAKVLQAGYDPSPQEDPQIALRRALSRYNTGSAQRGLVNGYVAKVSAAAAHIVPALSPQTAPRAPDMAPAPSAPPPEDTKAPPSPPWDVFRETRQASGFMVQPAASLAEGRP